MHDDRRNQGFFEGPMIMLLSAAIFGFFGFFYVNWNTLGVDGNPVLFRVLLGWTLKTTAILFAASAGLAALKPYLGNLLYALTGVASAGLFFVVAIMDIADDQHGFMPYGPVVLLLFAGWNGFGSWSALRAVLAMRRMPGAAGE